MIAISAHAKSRCIAKGIAKNLLAHGSLLSWYRHREKAFAPYFDQENDLVYCPGPKGLLEKFGICYNH